MKTEILAIHTPALFEHAVQRAAQLLRQGQVVGLPTETVYGLAADAFNQEAVARIFALKGRPASNPIIVHVAGLGMARQCVAVWPEAAAKLAEAFWPGPLTLVLPRASQIPGIVTAGGGTVGVRWPSHPFMQAVIAACGSPLAAPSANLSTSISPTNAQHVLAALDSKIPLIIDGGQCQVGIESTVVDLSGDAPSVLRPGMIHEEALTGVLGPFSANPGATSPILKSPGLLPRHYSPRAKLILYSWENDSDLKAAVTKFTPRLSKVHIIAHSRIPSGEYFGRVAVVPHDAEAFARALYAELHACDAAKAELIVVEALPSRPEWRALQDRLGRASAS